MPSYPKRSESTLVTEVMRYLQILENAKKIAFWSRQQAGSLAFERKGRWAKVRLGRTGIADLWMIVYPMSHYKPSPIIWIECKTEDGKQSQAQKDFQGIVEECGHIYLLIRSCDELERELKESGLMPDWLSL